MWSKQQLECIGMAIQCSLRQWFSKWGPRPPGVPGAECQGSASIQSNIGGPCTFKDKNRE